MAFARSLRDGPEVSDHLNTVGNAETVGKSSWGIGQASRRALATMGLNSVSTRDRESSYALSRLTKGGNGRVWVALMLAKTLQDLTATQWSGELTWC